MFLLVPTSALASSLHKSSFRSGVLSASLRPGINILDASSTRSEVIKVCPRSMAIRKMVLRAISWAKLGAFANDASASWLQLMVSSATISNDGLWTAWPSHTWHGARRSRFSALPPISRAASAWTPVLPTSKRDASTFLR